MSVFVLSHAPFCLIPKGSHLDSKLPGDKNSCAQHFASSSTWGSTWFGIDAQCLLLGSNPSCLLVLWCLVMIMWAGWVMWRRRRHCKALLFAPPLPHDSSLDPPMVFKVGMEQAGLWTQETTKTSR